MAGVLVAATFFAISCVGPADAKADPIAVARSRTGDSIGGDLVTLSPRTARRITRLHNRPSKHPEISDDGRRVLWAEGDEGAEEIWISHIDGSHTRRLTANALWDAQGDWSPHGKRLVETRERRRGGSALWIVAISGRSHRLVRRGESPDWSAATGWIAFNRDFSILTVRPDGASLRHITRPSQSHSDGDPQWSPNGRWILFKRVSGSGSKLMIVRSDGSHLHVLVDSQKSLTGYQWAPNGRKVLYQRIVEVVPTRSEVRVVNRRGHKNHVVAGPFGSTYPITATWSPHSTRIVFDRYEKSAGRVTSDLWMARADGSRIRRLTHTDRAEHEPAWATAQDSDASF